MTQDEADQLVERETFEDEIEVLSETEVRVGVLDRLEGITPAMFEWWIGNMDAENYRRWHPRDHKGFGWDGDRVPGHHIGHTHWTRQSLGGSGALMYAQLTFIDPSEMLDTSKFEAYGVGAAIIGVIRAIEAPGRPRDAEAGRLIHLLLHRPYGAEMRTCAWLSVPESGDVQTITRGRQKHIHEECGFLQGFLPALYTERTEAGTSAGRPA